VSEEVLACVAGADGFAAVLEAEGMQGTEADEHGQSLTHALSARRGVFLSKSSSNFDSLISTDGLKGLLAEPAHAQLPPLAAALVAFVKRRADVAAGDGYGRYPLHVASLAEAALTLFTHECRSRCARQRRCDSVSHS